MNLAGKIITLLIFFLSVAFLVLAIMVGATHQEWKQIATENKQKVAQARTILDSYKGKQEEIKQTLDSERVSRRLQLAQLNSQLTQSERSLETKTSELQKELEVSATNQEALNIAEKRMSELDTQVTDLRGTNKGLIDDIAEQRKKVVNLTNQVYSLEGQVKDLEIVRMDLTEELAARIKVMNAEGLSRDALTDHIPPEVDGVVLRTKNNLIAISVGGDDGVREGHVFDIFRGDRFIGKAEVTTARNNMSAARLISEFQRAPVAEGDHVTTKY